MDTVLLLVLSRLRKAHSFSHRNSYVGSQTGCPFFLFVIQAMLHE